MIRATFDPAVVRAATTSSGGRRITGVAVPWGVPGRVSDGTVVVFERGSLDAAARPVALLDHDRTRPIGRVTDATDTGAVMTAAIGVLPSALGDQALIEAAPPLNVRGALSVGAEPIDYRYDADGVLHVTSADWQELSLLTLGAYADARVTQVAASSPNQQEPTMPDILEVLSTDEPTEPDDGEPTDDEPTEDQPTLPDQAAPAPVPVTAARGRAARRSPYENVTLHQLARIIQASRANPDAARQRDLVLAAQGPLSRGIEAALADITLTVGTDNVGELFRPAYQRELVELISWGTPMIDAIRAGTLQRGDYPSLTFNTWEKTPEVALRDIEKTEIHSAPVKITPQSVDVHTWAGGNDLSQTVLDLGSPGFVEDYLRAAGIDYARKVDTYAVTTLLAAANAVTIATDDSFISVVGALVGALSPATTPPGGLFLAMSYDVGVGLIGVPVDQGPAFWDGNVAFGTFTPSTNAGGLSTFIDPNMPAGTYLLGHRQGATWYQLPGTPFNLRAVNVGLLGLDIGIYGYGALGIQYPGAFAKATVPVGP